jgi:hypothetical protein
MATPTNPATKDSWLWYNPGNWGPFGLAVPNWGRATTSKNGAICRLVRVIGRSTQLVMFHTDAMLYRPPTLNTVQRIHQMCTRARQILAGRSVPENETLLEATHAIPATQEHILHPVPYFKVRNEWLKEYCMLSLITMTEMIQHTDNQREIDVTEAFTLKVSSYIRRIYSLVGSELFNLPKERVEALDFTLTDEDFKNYAPSKLVAESEMIDTLLPETEMLTEDMLEPLTNGIPLSLMPELGRWPTGSPSVDGTTQASSASQQNASWPS